MADATTASMRSVRMDDPQAAGSKHALRKNSRVPRVPVMRLCVTPVAAMSGGRVRFSGTMEDFGLVVWLDHDDEVVTVYAHLSELRVQTGDQLAKSDIVGLSGSTGNATGPHLHFEIWRRGVQLDPVAMLGGPPGP